MTETRFLAYTACFALPQVESLGRLDLSEFS